MRTIANLIKVNTFFDFYTDTDLFKPIEFFSYKYKYLPFSSYTSNHPCCDDSPTSGMAFTFAQYFTNQLQQHILPSSSMQPPSFIQLLKQGSSKSNKKDVVGYVFPLFVVVRELCCFFVPESEWFRFIKLPRKRDSIRLNLYA